MKHFDMASNHSHCRMDGFLHHLTQMTGMQCFPLAWHHCCLNGQQLATNTGPGKPCYLSNLINRFGKTITELFHTQKLFNILASDINFFNPFMRKNIFYYFSAYRGNITFKIPDSGFPRIMTDNFMQGVLRKLNFLFLQAI